MSREQNNREALDLADWVECMDQYGPQTARCAGNRIVVSGYQCPHCGSANPSEDCEEPMHEDRTP